MLSNPIPRLFQYGSAECDQYSIPNDVFISRLPIESLFFSSNNIIVYKIVCGALHTLALSTTGQVYSWGNNDLGALGRITESGKTNIPGLVELECKVDNITAGDTHSVAVNSKNGIVFLWGVYRNTTGGNMSDHYQTPIRWGKKEFTKKTIDKVVSGANHTLILASSGNSSKIYKKVYAWGDPDTGVLGRMPCERRKFTQSLSIEALGVKNVENIWSGGYQSFLQQIKLVKNKNTGEKDKKSKVLAWGLNNYGQLGLGNTENSFMPKEIVEFNDQEISDIQGGEHHTIVLMKNGEVYGFGRNDDGQLGIGEQEKEEDEKSNAFCFKSKPCKISNLSNIDRIFCGSTFSYALNSSTNQLYTWGDGDHYVLANGKEEPELFPYQVKPFFTKEQTILDIALGAQHGTFTIITPGSAKPELDINISIVNEELFKKKKEKKDEEKSKSSKSPGKSIKSNKSSQSIKSEKKPKEQEKTLSPKKEIKEKKIEENKEEYKEENEEEVNPKKRKLNDDLDVPVKKMKVDDMINKNN